LPALSTMVSVPENEPTADGVKLRAITHDAPPPASVLPQVVPAPSTANTALVVVTLLILIVPPETGFGLESVTNLSALVVMCGTVPNDSEVGIIVSGASVPVPFRAIVAGLFLALLVTIRLPVSAPCIVGLNASVTVQLVLAASTPVHPSATTAKSPEVATLPMVSPTEFELVRVAFLVALVPPTWVLANARLGERVSDAWMPVPARLTVCGLFGPLEGMVAVPV